MADSAVERYDYLVVGGGSAGCIVAARLAERLGAEVCLLEAGPSDEGLTDVEVLPNWPRLLGTDLDYAYEVETGDGYEGEMRLAAARVLGGSGSHNGGIALLPTAGDFERWLARGAAGWDAASLRPATAAMLERLEIEEAPAQDECARAIVAAAEAAGFPALDFARDEVGRGVGWLRFTKRGRMRVSSATGYLHPLAELPDNLSVRTDSPVARVLFDDGAAVGVELLDGTRIEATAEVVLSAGAIGSPKLLLQSGIGARDQLESLGVDVVHDVPAVGERLADHPELMVVWKAKQAVDPVDGQVMEAVVFDCPPAGGEPDVEFHTAVFTDDFYGVPPELRGIGGMFAIAPSLTRPRSRGRVSLRGSDPGLPPRIELRLFSDGGGDERALVRAVREARRIVATEPLAPWRGEELLPGPGVAEDDEALGAFVRRGTTTSFHPAGTCAIGAPGDRDAVVDPSLRVQGVEGLRVADASVFPEIVLVNPALSCMLVGERCAELIAAER
ncbi:MAG: GMC family oxidoreductase [Actinobacteria bacterium]|nr:GMC family oxidoreductase [Actinomycetota bacterium]